MCKALEDLYQDGVNEGMEKGIEKGLEQGMEKGLEQGLKALISFMQESGCDKSQILKKLKEDFSLDDKRADDYFVKFGRK